MASTEWRTGSVRASWKVSPGGTSRWQGSIRRPSTAWDEGDEVGGGADRGRTAGDLAGAEPSIRLAAGDLPALRSLDPALERGSDRRRPNLMARSIGWRLSAGAEADQAAFWVQELGIDVEKNTCFWSSSLAMILLASSLLRRLGSEGLLPRGKMASSRILASGKSLRSSRTTAPMPSAISGPLASPALLGADHEHDGLGFMTLALAILQAPKNTLCRVPGNAEIGDLHVTEVLVEDTLAAWIAGPSFSTFHRSVIESPRNRMSKSPLVANFYEASIPHAADAGRGTDAEIIARHPHRDERLVFPEQVLVGHGVALDELLQVGIDPRDFLGREDLAWRLPAAPEPEVPAGRTYRGNCPRTGRHLSPPGPRPVSPGLR